MIYLTNRRKTSLSHHALRSAVRTLLILGICISAEGLLAQPNRVLGPGEPSAAGRNQFGPMDSTCRGACGEDCPSTCDVDEYRECAKGLNAILFVTRYSCGTHKGCRDHDTCLDGCLAPFVYDHPWSATAEFIGGGDCQRDCHFEAHAYAESEYPGHGFATIFSWANGHGPYDGRDVWEYTRDKEDGPDRTEPCGDCEYCSGGQCFPRDDCDPCNSCNDVHLYTLDGLKFDFQAAGEFTLLANGSRSFVLQARQEQRAGGKASVNTAVAMNVGASRVGVYLPDILRIDGEEVTLNHLQFVDLPGGGNVRRLERAYMITWPNEARVSVRVRQDHFNVGVVLPDEMKGTVRGILGNFDGDETNDLFSAGGEQFAKPLTYEKLYRQYGDTWRITRKESLFDYDAGKNTGSYQLPEFPGQLVRTDDLDKNDRDRAAETCSKAGVIGDTQLADCIFDVALTGNDAFAENNELSKTVVKEVLRIEGEAATTSPEVRQPAAAPTEASDIVLRAPESPLAGFKIEIRIEGTTKDNDFITIVAPEAPAAELGNRARVRGRTVTIDLPTTAGEYEIRYVAAAEPRRILGHTPVTVRPLQVSLEAPDAWGGGSEVNVVVRGKSNPEDFVTIVPVGSPEGDLHRKSRARISDGTLGFDQERTLRLVAPEAAGDYEIRYVTNAQPRKTYATVTMVVSKACSAEHNRRGRSGCVETEPPTLEN